MNKLTKIVLSFLMVITCINFSTVQAEDGEEVNYSEPTTVETVSEDPANEVEQEVAQEEPAVEEAPAEQPAEEAAPVEEPQQEEVAPEASEEAQVEEATATPEEATAAAEPQQEATATPEETQEEAKEEPAEVQKATVEISYVDEEDKEIADKVSDKEFDVDFVVTADDKEVYKDIDGYTFKEAIVNDDAENRTFTADTIKLDGLKVTSDMNKVKLVYSKNPVATKKDTTVKKTPKKASGLLGALEKAVDTLTGKTEETSDDADPLSTSDENRLQEFFVVADRNTVTVGDKTNVSVTIKPDNYPNKDVTWTTSNPEVATVENGVVTTHAVGTVTITATLASDETVTSSTTIVVEDVKVNKITITGYTQKYLEVDDTVTLGKTIEPENAANKDIIWSSSNPDVATVDQNGVVTAIGQGTTTIQAKNEVSGVFGTQKITVYDSTPYTATVNVWVTNQNKNVSYNFYVAKDGTVVNVSDIKQNTKQGNENYISKGNIRVIPTLSGSANWATIQSYPIVQAFKYSEDQLQYTTDGTNWENVDGYSIYDFSAMQYDSKYSGAFNNSDIAVTIGDWPYGATQATGHNKQTIQIVLLNTEDNNKEVYDSGVMRYDNGSSGEYGKINFNSENSKYEVTKVEVYNGSKLINTYENGEIPSDLSVSFSSQATNHYVIKAYATAKTINVSYVATGATEGTIPEATTVKTINPVTVATQVPEKEGSIFVGWEYNGRTYRGGDSLEASSSDIVFTARFVSASEIINYTVNDSSMGSVSRTYERVGETVESNPVGSTAIAKTGHKFVKWVNAAGKQVSTEVDFTPADKTPTTYTAVFEKIKSNLTIHYVDKKGNKIHEDETKEYSYGESWTEVAPDIQGYTKPSETTQTGTMGVKNEEITFTYTQKVGKVVYNLGPNGSWGNGGAPEYTAISDAEKGKWAYTYGFDKGDTFVVTDKVPVSSDNAVFVGWYDKKRDTTSATMRKAWETVTYPYTTSSKTNSYTLDALWEKLSGNSDTVTYDGKLHRLAAFTVMFANTNLTEWTDSASSLVQASNIQYRVKQDDREANEWGEMPSFTDAGTYTIEAQATVNGVVLTAEATLIIEKRKVTLTSGSDFKTYDGTPLTKNEVTVGGEKFAAGEGATYDVTGSQTVVGNSKNTFTYTLNEGTSADNYEITPVEGSLEVKDRTEKLSITVRANGGTATYDGKDHTVSGLETTEFTVNGKKFTVEGLSAAVTGKNAGSYTNEVKGTATVKDEAKNDVTSQFTVSKVDGSLEISKRKVTLTSGSDFKTYDGTPLTKNEVTVGGEKFAAGEGATYDVTGSQTVVGNSKNTFKYALLDGTNVDNYTITKSEGTLTVNPYDEAITAKVFGTRATHVYDGHQYSVSGYRVEFEMPDGTPTSLSGTKVVLKTGKKAQASGRNVGDYKMNLDASDFDWTDNNFSNVTISIAEDGLLKITPASIDPENTRFMVTGLTDVLYNGAEQKQTPTIKDTTTGEDLVKDTDYTITCNTEDFTNAGTITYTIKGKGNYSGTREVSYKIKQRVVNLKSDTASKTYDGTALTRPNVTVTGNGFVEGEATAIATGSVINVTATPVDNTIAVVPTEGSNYNVNNYDIHKDEGKLSITAADITPTDPENPDTTRFTVEKPADTTYNGNSQQQKPVVKDGEKVLVEDTNYTLEYPDNTTDANDKVEVIIHGIGNYTGTRTTSYAINRKAVTLTSADDSKTYDGQPLTAESVTAEGFVERQGATYSGFATVTVVTPAAGVDNTFSYSLNEGTNADNYEITQKFGKLIVNPVGTVTVTIVGNSDTVTYDGSVHEVKGYEVTNISDSLYSEADIKFDGNASVTRTEEGTSTMGITDKNFSNTNTNFGTVNFVVTDGSLTITAASIDPELPDPTNPDNPTENTRFEVTGLTDVLYNGAEQKQTPTITDTTTGKALVKDTDYTITCNTEDFTNAGTITYTLSGIGNYSGTRVVSYKIKQRTVNLKSDTASKTYDGTALTRPDVTVTGDGFVEGEAEAIATGSVTYVSEGEVTNTIAVVSKKKSNYNANNYDIHKDEGKLSITAADITPTDPENPDTTRFTVEKPADTTYNGNSQQQKPVVKDGEKVLVEGEDYTLTYPENTTDANANVEVTITGIGNYTGTRTTSYAINRKAVTLTSADGSKTYDGQPLTAESVTPEGFVEGQGATYGGFATVIEVTETAVPNTFSYTLNEGTLESNYNITTNYGSLTITPKTIVPDGPETPEEKKTGIEVTEPEDSKYTGEEHKNAPTVTDTKTGKTLAEGTDYTLTYSDDVTNAGKVTVTVTGIGNYTGEFNVTYEITKRNVVLTSATDSKKFDGTPLRNENVEVTGEGFAEGEGATYSEFAEVTNVTDEAVANTFTYTLNDNTLASNYNISTEFGTLTITPKTITPDQPGTPEEEKTGITVDNPGDVKYDGKDHAEKPVIKDEKTGVTLEEGKDYEIVYPEDIKNAGEITATVVGKGDYDGSFEIKFNILKRDVTFTSATDSKQYDGNVLTNGNVEITGDGFIEGEGATFNVTGSITDVGSTNNAFTYAMNEGTNADNYNVTVVEGTLTVSEQPVVPTPVTPTTPSNNTPARTNNVPARAVTNPTTTTPAPEATVEPEKAETTPAPTAKPEKIKEEATPQAAPKGHWALINLIAAMLSVVLAVVALLAKHAKDEDEDDEDKDDQVVANENEDDDENESTRHRRWKVIATIDAILAVVVFILTENISLPMVLVDKWTLLMVLFGLISIVSTYFARKWHEEDEDEDEESSQNA